MDKKINLNYTAEAKKHLESMKNDYVSMIEDAIIDRKYIPGERTIEVTVSDVEAAASRITLLKPFTSTIGYRFKRGSVFLLASRLYILFGSATLLYGLFGREILELYFRDPHRFAFLITGFLMIIVGIFINRYYAEKEDRYYKMLSVIRQDSSGESNEEYGDYYNKKYDG